MAETKTDTRTCKMNDGTVCTLAEFQKMAPDAGLEGFEVKQYLITHVGIEKKSVHAKPCPRRGFRGLKGALMQYFYKR